MIRIGVSERRRKRERLKFVIYRYETVKEHT